MTSQLQEDPLAKQGGREFKNEEPKVFLEP
jgi:hypothetical protein